MILLSDYNLNSDGSYNEECGGNINDTYNCSTLAFDSDNTNIYDENDSNNIGYFIKYIYEPLVTSVLPSTTNITLPTAEQIALADSKSFNQSNLALNSSWLLTTNYWTKTAYASNNSDVWRVNGEGFYILHYYAYYPYDFGVRPVITTLKSNILE